MDSKEWISKEWISKEAKANYLGSYDIEAFTAGAEMMLKQTEGLLDWMGKYLIRKTGKGWFFPANHGQIHFTTQQLIEEYFNQLT